MKDTYWMYETCPFDGTTPVARGSTVWYLYSWRYAFILNTDPTQWACASLLYDISPFCSHENNKNGNFFHLGLCFCFSKNIQRLKKHLKNIPSQASELRWIGGFVNMPLSCLAIHSCFPYPALFSCFLSCHSWQCCFFFPLRVLVRRPQRPSPEKRVTQTYTSEPHR